MSAKMDWTCPHCDTLWVDLEVSGNDGDDPDPELAVDSCRLLACGKILCEKCPKFVCDGCSLLYCREHAVALGEDLYCPDCMEDISETAAEIAAEEAMEYSARSEK